MLKHFEILRYFAFPLIFISYSAYFIPITFYKLLTTFELSTLLSLSAFKDAWFAEFWKSAGPGVREDAKPRVQPLIQLAHGVVLDIGPGSGEWLSLFDKSKVKKIYGVEPNRDHHELLGQRITQAGLDDIYVIVPVGVEDLDGKGVFGGQKKPGGWIQQGEVDSVVTIQCLCSIPNPQQTIKGLYPYLKEGGMWIAYEHVVVKRDGIVRHYQGVVNIVWPHFLGGCSLTRDTEKWLKDAGSWTKVDLKQPDDEPDYLVIPHTMGVLTK